MARRVACHFVGFFFTAVVAVSGFAERALACGGNWDVACNIGDAGKKAVNDTVNTAKKAVDDTVNTGKKAVDDTVNTADKAKNDTVNAAKKAIDDAGNTAKKALDDTLNTAHKAVDDVAWNYAKSANDLIDAGKAIGRFVDRQVKGYRDSLSDAEKRVREGKVVDAMWHLSTDQYKHTEENAAKATQESDIIKTAGQVAATAYGGPGGAAAYAAWVTYRETGDADLALRAGVITGIASAGFAAAGQMPTGTAGELAKKAIVTGAIGGLAVAAAGGDRDAVRDGFLMSGGMVLVQAGYEKVTTHPLDARASQGEPYCMATVGATCSPELSAYERDAQGNILFDENGDPKVDVRKTDPLRPHVGKWSDAEGNPRFVGEKSSGMIAVSKIPGMNAMSVLHDQWAVSWNMNAFTTVATIPPAVVLTYIGTGSPYYDKLQSIAAEQKKREAAVGAPQTASGSPAASQANPSLGTSPEPSASAALPPREGMWVAVQNVGDPKLFFTHVIPKTGKATVDAGDIVVSNRDISIRRLPADWADPTSTLKSGSTVVVVETRNLNAKGASQTWARVDLVK
jgi:hypothetical protein